MTIITFSITEELEKNLDEAVKRMGFVSRSEAIRYALRLLFSELTSLDELRGKVLSVVTVLYGKEAEKARVYEVQHKYGDVINAYFHSHIEGSKCLEIMVVQGDAERVRDFISGLRASRHLEQVKVITLSQVED